MATTRGAQGQCQDKRSCRQKSQAQGHCLGMRTFRNLGQNCGRGPVRCKPAPRSYPFPELQCSASLRAWHVTRLWPLLPALLTPQQLDRSIPLAELQIPPDPTWVLSALEVPRVGGVTVPEAPCALQAQVQVLNALQLIKHGAGCRGGRGSQHPVWQPGGQTDQGKHLQLVLGLAGWAQLCCIQDRPWVAFVPVGTDKPGIATAL